MKILRGKKKITKKNVKSDSFSLHRFIISTILKWFKKNEIDICLFSCVYMCVRVCVCMEHLSLFIHIYDYLHNLEITKQNEKFPADVKMG